MTSKINDNIFLTITLNVLIASAATYLINPKLFNQNSFQSLLATWYGLSIVFLVICYLVIQKYEDNIAKKESINKRGYSALRFNLFCTSLLLFCLILINNLATNHPLIGASLLVVACLSIAANLVIPPILALKLFLS